jgi:hypothetical protein
MLATLLITLTGCAASKVGVLSLPHLAGDEPVADRGKTDMDDKRTVDFRGHTFRFHLRNDVQTSETFWVGIEVPMIPLKRDRERGWRVPYSDGPYCIWITVSASRDGDAFRPRSVTLELDGVVHRPISAKLRRSGLGNDLSLSEGESAALPTGQDEHFVLCFDVERPEPDREIVLHMADALVTPDGERMPDVRFVMARWTFAH